MLKHYFLVSWRNIVRNKFYSLILTVGLALGVAASLMLGMYAWHELTYDNFHEKADRIFLVGVDSKEGAEEYKTGSTTPPTGPALQQYFPEVESFARLSFWVNDVVVSHEDRKFAEKGLVAADSSVFNIFTIPFLAGNPETALKEPNTIVITEAIARKYFDGKDPMGQTLQFDHFFSNCKVTGVVKNYPDNSHFDFDILLSLSSFKAINFDFDNSWGNHALATYVLLNKNASVEDLASRLPEFTKKQLNPYLIQRYQKSFDELYKGGDHYKLFLTPLKEVYLSALLHDRPTGRKTLVYALCFIGVMILILVCVNYTNLATILSFSRAKEAGIRKVAGSRHSSLFKQFLTESLVIAFAGLFLGLVLVEFLSPVFNLLTKQSLEINYFNPLVALGLLLFTLMLGLLAGFYPALTFASFNPIRALKGNATISGNSHWHRSAPIVFQFTICMVMTVSTIVVYRQLSFMTEKNLGFAKDQVLVIKRVEGLKANKTAFKNELKKAAGVLSVSYSETTPGRNFNGQTQHFKGRPSTENPVVHPFIADEDILETLDIDLIAGRSFKENNTTQSKALLNESAVNMLGLADPMEEKIDRGTMGATEIEIVGVVKDFHFQSLHREIQPLIIFPLDVENDPYHNATFVLVKIAPQDVRSTLEYVESEWKKFAGNYPFEYSFLDEDFNTLFEEEQTMASVYTAFSIISVIIACLGLLGITSYFTNKRTKEIGIRKIVGASVPSIALLLSRQLLSRLAISIIIGSTLAWHLMNLWLQGFAYKTPMDAWVFVLSGGLILMLSLVTISWHLYSAASKNPVETLKSE